jgi:hypothetical protein
VWSGDGRTLAHLGTTDGLPQAYEATVDGSTPVHVLPEGLGIPTSRSADGGLLFFGPTRDNVSLGV